MSDENTFKLILDKEFGAGGTAGVARLKKIFSTPNQQGQQASSPISNDIQAWVKGYSNNFFTQLKDDGSNYQLWSKNAAAVLAACRPTYGQPAFLVAANGDFSPTDPLASLIASYGENDSYTGQTILILKTLYKSGDDDIKNQILYIGDNMQPKIKFT